MERNRKSSGTSCFPSFLHVQITCYSASKFWNLCLKRSVIWWWCIWYQNEGSCMPYLHCPSSGKLSAQHNTNLQMLLVIARLVPGKLTINISTIWLWNFRFRFQHLAQRQWSVECASMPSLSAPIDTPRDRDSACDRNYNFSWLFSFFLYYT